MLLLLLKIKSHGKTKELSFLNTHSSQLACLVRQGLLVITSFDQIMDGRDQEKSNFKTHKLSAYTY